VTKILLAGGMAETFGLVPFLKKVLNEKYPQIKVMTFENEVKDNDTFHVQFYEMSAYAASVGGAVVAMKDYSVDAVLSYSYGTWMYEGDYKCLALFADRGALLLEDQNPFKIIASFGLSPYDLPVVQGDEIFSTFITSDDIAHGRYGDVLQYENGYPVVGDDRSPARLAAERVIDLKVVSGGPKTEIRFFYQGKRVSISGAFEQKIYFEEGFIVDKDGVAKPFLRNLSKASKEECIGCTWELAENEREIIAREIDSNGSYAGSVMCIRARDIDFLLTMKDIEIETNT
jgi:hypothetical protein